MNTSILCKIHFSNFRETSGPFIEKSSKVPLALYAANCKGSFLFSSSNLNVKLVKCNLITV